jgi:hypothetical protein
MSLARIDPEYWRLYVRAAVLQMHKNHERRMLTDPEYRKRQLELEKQYEEIFNSSRQMVEGDL